MTRNRCNHTLIPTQLAVNHSPIIWLLEVLHRMVSNFSVECHLTRMARLCLTARCQSMTYAEYHSSLLARCRAAHSSSFTIACFAYRHPQAYIAANKNLYEITFYIDPWSGKTLSSRIVLMISTTIWRCNPAVDASCGLFAANSTDLCYANPATPDIM